MRRAGTSKSETAEGAEDAESVEIKEEDQKVIVRSNGTVGYVGKDIAYHMWKFGLLGRDFGYRKFYRYPNAHDCWISTTDGEKDHPHFGDVAEIYNVIDTRQAEAQNTVIEALRGLGHDEAADRYTHFSYEMVALTPRCAAELGYNLSDEDKARPWLEVSGRKGFGVKADDLLDALIAAAGKEVDGRHPELSAAERASIATQIAIGALRFFMLKFTKPSVIAFDFNDALSFEGTRRCALPTFSARADWIRRVSAGTRLAATLWPRAMAALAETRQASSLREISLSSLTARPVTKSGNSGSRPPRLLISFVSALLPRNLLIWPNMPSNWRSFSIPSITAIPS
jgi:hypothetical protein